MKFTSMFRLTSRSSVFPWHINSIMQATLVEFKIIHISLDFGNSIRRLVTDTVLKPGRTPTHKLNGLFWEQHLLCTLESGETFAFVQYEVQEDATRALDATNNSKLMDKVISVAYAVKDDDARGNGHSPERRRDTSPERRRRSPSPYKRERGSPDYGRGGASPVAAYRKDRTSPGNGRRRSPSPYKRSRRGSHKYGRDRRGNESPRRRERYSRSPNNRRETLKKENPSGEVESPNERRSNPENGQVEGLDGGYNSAEEQVSFASSS